jgi:hypothetical protein
MRYSAAGLLIAILGSALALEAQPRELPAPAKAADRPDWVVEGVPDSVWILVEASTGVEDDERRRLLDRAEGHARSALQGHETDVGRRFGLAIVLGSRANTEGGKTKVQAASQLHQELETILGLDPEHARAHHLIGRLHAGVRRMNRVTRWLATNLLGGGELKKATWDEAERHLRFAEEHAPEVTDHHLQLANLFRDTDREEAALQEVIHVLERPARSPMEEAVLSEARRLLADLGYGHIDFAR